MPYREELDAALARAQAAEERLAAARQENERDHARITELEERTRDEKQTKKTAERDHARIAELEKEVADARLEAEIATQGRSASRTRETRSWLRENVWVALCVAFPFALALVLTLRDMHRKTSSSAAAPPTRLDLESARARAESEARKTMSDAVLAQLDTQASVDATGVIDLNKGFATFDFVSPSRAARAQDSAIHVALMPNAKPTVIQQNGPTTAIHDPPRCTARAVWAQAIRRGAPPNALASLHFGATTSGPAWQIRVQPDFEMTLPDECAATAR